MSKLFRRQVIERQADSLHGEVLLLPRFSHALILIALLTWFFATLMWLTTSSYARKETVAGWLEPTSGVVRVYAERIGIIKKILVEDGQRVVKDQPLIVVNGDRILSDGQHLESLLLAEYESQRTLLSDQLHRSEVIHARKLIDIEQRISSTKEDIALLQEQRQTLDHRYQLLQEQVARHQELKLEGHISVAELDAVIAQELALRGQRQALERNRVNLINQLQQVESQKALLPEEHANGVSQLRTRLSDLAQQIAQLHGQRAYIVKAPKDGIVNNLQIREGQQAQPNIPVLSLVPEGSGLNAELLVPVRSAGFLAPGQKLNIRYDAFPYQKFGLYPGEVVEVSDTLLLPDELLKAPVAIREPAYRVTARLDRPSVQAYGKDFALKPGMTLSADVQLTERTLLQWLLEPLYSLKGRL
ncbi:HlyD family secretion protein [Microbulbifer pacificus]|uniref:HlyD family secretion protein n=1 Tax=Microbulbifer pacificus TaxID=407164 RepID=UPI000CF3BAE8|nr:HlyD family efflux transporter periplasmic adaptor subunit [Microbulbifer pacificus]